MRIKGMMGALRCSDRFGVSAIADSLRPGYSGTVRGCVAAAAVFMMGSVHAQSNGPAGTAIGLVRLQITILPQTTFEPAFASLESLDDVAGCLRTNVPDPLVRVAATGALLRIAPARADGKGRCLDVSSTYLEGSPAFPTTLLIEPSAD